ncbi:uncharacterized protein UTRI_01007_B [Ustilago trichophora]|uniref:CsbD-like domain-containing protein n=1 Tax=Ustilago trichophora TaxID=86804 RepID=A0A5C3DVC7_9BASI|nr:uncharacterized protein UTRI_01007_B [Ustilago trichophora]
MTDTTESRATTAYTSIATTLVAEATGFAALSETYPSTSTQLDQTTSSSRDPTSSEPHAEAQQQAEEEKQPIIARQDHSEELERGPSDPSRTSAPQNHIGTESGIPTTAGAGTTVSPDDDVQEAYRKEQQQNKNQSSTAQVGVDYSDQPCPTSDARRENPTSEPAEGKTTFESREEQLNGNEDVSNSNGNGSGSWVGSSERTQSTDATSTEVDSQASKGVGLKDKLKGQAKVVAGKLTRNEEKVEAGRALKAGAAQA